MKRKQRKIMSLFLAGMMLCIPTSQALAETAYEADSGISGQLLFPNDSLVNLTSGVAVEGEEVALDGNSWTNQEKGIVYWAESDEDGMIQITKEGYMLVVVGGMSAKYDPEEETPDHHYENPDKEASETKKDIACYDADETVRLIADEPEEGMVFAGWTAETEGVSFGDSSASDTTIKMLDKKVRVIANYEPAPAEEPTVEEIPAEEPIVEETPAEEPVVVEPEAGEPVVVESEAGEPVVVEPATEEPIVEEVKPSEYIVTVNNGTESGTYIEGTTVTVTAYDRTSEGLQFSCWEAENAALDDIYAQMASFVMPSADVTVTATYTEIIEEPTEYQVTVVNGSGGGVYSAEAYVMLEADDCSSEGKQFDYWIVDMGNVELENPFSPSTGFTMPEDTVVVTAVYSDIETEVTEVPASAETEMTETPVSTETEATEAPVSTETEMTEAPLLTETEATETPASTETEAAETPVLIETETTTTETDVIVVDQTNTVVNEQPDSETAEQTETSLQTPDTSQEESGPTTEKQTETSAAAYTVVVENGLGSGEYEAGAAVVIEASELEGMVFKGWELNTSAVVLEDPSAEVTSFTMPNENVTIKAVFAEAQFEAQITNGTFENGSSGPQQYAAGNPVKIIADDPEDGFLFSHWEGTAVINDTEVAVAFTDAYQAETVFTMPRGTVSVTAVYKADEKTYSITVANGLINGTVNEADLKENTEFTITANEAPFGQEFSYWEINDGAYDLGDDAYSEKLTLKATEDMKILAIFEGIEYEVTVTDGYSDYDVCVVGTVVTVTADEAPEGYEFDYWHVDTENTALTDAYSEKTTFTMPDGDVEISAHYRQVEYLVTVENGYADQDYYYAGDTVTVYSNYPAAGREFGEWAAVSGNVTFGNTSKWKTTFTMPASNVVIKAVYKDGPSADNNQILDIVAGGEYYTGDTITFSASGAGMSNSDPNPGDYRYRPSGYQIGNVTGTWQAAPYTTSMAIKATGEYTLKVIFNKDVYDGTQWKSDGTSAAKTVTFKVVTKAAGVATGDNTPILMVAAIGMIACVIFVILLIMSMKKRKRR